jgi:hypothetical protein
VFRPRRGAGGVAGAPGGYVDRRRDRDGHQQEHGQGEDVLPLGDGELVDRRYEVEVEQQRRGDGRGQGGQQPADERDDHDPDQEQQDVAGQRQILAKQRQYDRQRRKSEGGQRQTGAAPPPAQRGTGS